MEVLIGHVTHYYNRIGVAVLELTGELKVGDVVLILGHTTDFTQVVSSMEIDHRRVEAVVPGQDVALKVAEPVRRWDEVYKVVEGEQDAGNGPEKTPTNSGSKEP